MVRTYPSYSSKIVVLIVLLMEVYTIKLTHFRCAAVVYGGYDGASFCWEELFFMDHQLPPPKALLAYHFE